MTEPVERRDVPTRRTLLTAATAGLSGLVVPTAAARPTTDRLDTTADVDVVRAVDTVAAVSDRVTGHLDLAAVEALRETDLEALDRRTAADLDRRLAPVLGRGPSRVAGLRSLAGDLDAGTAASRVGPGVSAEGTRLLADLALDGAAARPADSEAFDADAVTAVTVADDELGSVASFALGVDVDGAFRADVSGEGVTVAEARRTLRAVGVPTAALDDLSASVGDDGVELAGSLAGTDGEQPFVVALLLVLLAAVVGTFVLGLGESVDRTERPPQVSLAFEYDTDGPVTITHRGGDNVPSSELVVVYTTDGQRRVERWADGDGVVQAGDEHTTVRAPDPDTEVRVVWSSSDGSTSATIAVGVVPP